MQKFKNGELRSRLRPRQYAQIFDEDWLRRALPHRRRRRECREEQQCNGAAPGTEPAIRIAGSRYIARSQHGWEPRSPSGAPMMVEEKPGEVLRPDGPARLERCS